MKTKEKKWKQMKEKLVEIMGSLDSPDAIQYFYVFIPGKLRGSVECPASIVDKIERICSENEADRQLPMEEVSEEERFAASLRNYTIALLRQIDRVDVLNYIKVIVEDIVKERCSNETESTEMRSSADNEGV